MTTCGHSQLGLTIDFPFRAKVIDLQMQTDRIRKLDRADAPEKLSPFQSRVSAQIQLPAYPLLDAIEAS
ncbi:MAG: hypothetical protein WBA24_18205 [Geitlerinemataceae cyanobacterium]